MEKNGNAQEEYFRLLAERWERTNKNDLREIKEYNKWKRNLRHLMLDED